MRFPADCRFELIFDLAWLVAAQPITTLKGCDIYPLPAITNLPAAASG
jgi:hypothetical protein